MAKGEARRRYAINFDLSIAQLRAFYDKDHPKTAYGKIKRYMLKNGFSHRQWSGYISNNTLSRPEHLPKICIRLSHGSLNVREVWMLLS